MNVSVSMKNEMIEFLVKKWLYMDPRTCECNKACKSDEHLDIENCSCEKDLIGKLVLECRDGILNTTETLLND